MKRKSWKIITFSKVFLVLVLSVLMLSGLTNTKVSVKADESNEDVKVITSNSSQVTLSSGHYKIEEDTTMQRGIVIPCGDTVYIDIPEGLTLTCNGINAVPYNHLFWIGYEGGPMEFEFEYRSGTTQSTPGILVEEGATLVLTGEGNVVTKGGDGSQAGNAITNSTVTFKYEFIGCFFLRNGTTVVSGFGQHGGYGANAPSPGIGGSGGIGGDNSYISEVNGTGHLGEVAEIYEQYSVNGNGRNGFNGGNGNTMGNVYVLDSVNVSATAGKNYQTVGKGGSFNDGGKLTIDSNSYSKDDSSLMLVPASTGGGGGLSTPAAIIGGGGAGGGGGASGTSGSYYFSYSGKKNAKFTTEYYNGSDGKGTSGGNGGLARAVKDPDKKYLDIKTGVGGKGGTSGLGGELYINDTASINGKLGTELKQTDLGAATNEKSGQGAKVSLLSTLTININKDGVLDSGHNVVLKSKDYKDKIIGEDSTGVHITQVTKEDVTYEIWVDNVNTGYTINANKSNGKTIDLYTCKVNVNLDDTPADLGEVSLIKNSEKITTLQKDNTGKYSFVYTYINPDFKEEANTYQIYVDNKDSVYTIDVKQDSEVTVDYYSAIVNLSLDGSAWDDNKNTVVLDSEDKSVKLNKTSTPGEYRLPLSKKDTRTYNVLVNSKQHNNNTIKITDKLEDRQKNISYFTGTVNVNVDGSPQKGAQVYFKNGELSLLIDNFESGVYSTVLPIIKDDQGNEVPWTVAVYGAVDSVEHTVSSTNKTITIDLLSVKFMTTGDATKGDTFNKVLHRTYLVRSGEIITPAPAPYLAGMTFDYWNETEYKLDEIPQAPFDFSTQITSAKVLYAHFAAPEVNINGYVKADENGALATKGEWFTMPNLSITGYGEGNVIKTIRITTINETIIKLPVKNGLTVKIDNVTQTPTGDYYVINNDNTIILTFDESITAKDAQKYLRSIIVKPKQSTDNTVSITTSSGEISGDKPAPIIQTKNATDPVILDGETLTSTKTLTSGIYYVKSNCSYTGAATTSGIKITGDVTIVIPEGVTLTAKGGNANKATGAGAGIEVTNGNTLRVYGKGTLNATGGNAANGSKGGNATITGYYSEQDEGVIYYYANETSGAGGAGGGGAGAGIGSKGGAGGDGGTSKNRGVSTGTYKDGGLKRSSITYVPSAGEDQAGKQGTSAGACGTIYLSNELNKTVKGGTAGQSGGAVGTRSPITTDPNTGFDISEFGEGAGGGSGYAGFDIGSGGAGGGGGGAGICGGMYNKGLETKIKHHPGGGGYGGTGAVNGASGVNDNVTKTGGPGGAGGVAGSAKTPIVINGATNTPNNTIKFNGATDATLKQQTYYFYYNNNKIVMPEYTPEPGKTFIGWKVSKYGRNVDNAQKPLTYEDQTVYMPSSTLVPDQGTYGNLELEPVVETIPPRSASDRLSIAKDVFIENPPEVKYHTYTVILDVDGDTKDLGPLIFRDKNDPSIVYEVDSTEPGVYTIQLPVEDLEFDVINEDGDIIGQASEVTPEKPAKKIECKTMKVQVNLDDVGTDTLGDVTLKTASKTLTTTQTYKDFKGTGLFTASVLSEDETNEEYDIYLDGKDTELKIEPSETKTLDHYSVKVNVKKDGTVTNDNVVTLCDDLGIVKYTLTLDDNGDYSYTLPSSEDTNTYHIYVDDVDSNQVASFTSEGHKPEEEDKFEVNYYTVTINTNKDGNPKDMGTVILKDKDGNEISVPPTSEGVYQVTRLESDTEYEIYVAGQDAKQQVKFMEDQNVEDINFHTVSVKIKLDSTAENAGQVVLKKDGYPDVVLTYDPDTDSYVGEVPTDEEYDIYVNGEDTGSTIVPGEEPSEVIEYVTIKYDIGEGTGYVPENTIYKDGDEVTLPEAIPTATGKQFIGWSYKGTTTYPNPDGTFDPVVVDKDHDTITAVYQDNASFECKYSTDGGETWKYSTIDFALEYAKEHSNKSVEIVVQNDATVSDGIDISSNVSIEVPTGKTLTIGGDSIDNNGIIECYGSINGKIINNNIIQGDSTNITGTIADIENKSRGVVSYVNITKISPNEEEITNEGTIINCNIAEGTNIGGKLNGVIDAASGVTFADSILLQKDENDLLPIIILEGGGTINGPADVNNTNTFAGLMGSVSEGTKTRYALKSRVQLRNKITVNDPDIYANFFDLNLPEDLKYDGTVKKATFGTTRTPGLGTVSNILYRHEIGLDDQGKTIWSDWSSDEPVLYGKYQVKIDVGNDGSYYNGMNDLTCDDWVYEVIPNPIQIKVDKNDMLCFKPRKVFFSFMLKGYKGTITAHIKNAFPSDELKVYQNGVELGEDVYEKDGEDSLKINFKPEYLKTLKVGTHKYKIVLTQNHTDFEYNAYIIVNELPIPKKDESCEKVIGPTWHWNNEKGICEDVGVVGTSTR